MTLLRPAAIVFLLFALTACDESPSAPDGSIVVP